MNKILKKKPKPKYTNIVYGVHPLVELLKSKRLKIGTIYTTKKPIKAWDQIKQLIPDYVQVSFVARETLDQVSGTKEHQGILAFVGDFPYCKSNFTSEKQKFVLVLDAVQDVRNLGAILRSAYCTGVDGVVLISKYAASLTPAAIKSSAGLAFHLPVHIAPSTRIALNHLKNEGFNIYCATLRGKESAATCAYDSPVALVVGNEETGISGEIARMGTQILLPQRRGDISYNASVAAGILMYSIGVQLKKI